MLFHLRDCEMTEIDGEVFCNYCASPITPRVKTYRHYKEEDWLCSCKGVEKALEIRTELDHVIRQKDELTGNLACHLNNKHPDIQEKLFEAEIKELHKKYNKGYNDNASNS